MFSLKIRDWGLQRLLTSADFSSVIYTWRKMQVGCSFPHSCLSQVPHPRAPTAPPWELVAPGIIQILCERQTQIPKPYLELTLDEFSVASDSTRWQAELSAPPASGEHRCCFSLQCKCFRVYSLALVVHILKSRGQRHQHISRVLFSLCLKPRSAHWEAQAT